MKMKNTFVELEQFEDITVGDIYSQSKASVLLLMG